MGRKKDLPVLEKVRISGIGAEGNALARVDNIVLFVPMLIPGDVADIQVTKKRKKYLEGRVVKFHEYSSDRVDPQCLHFGTCGGCKWQHLPYNLQLQYKEKQVIDNLTRIGKADLQGIRPISGSPDIYFYRNKLEYSFSTSRWLSREEIASGIKFESGGVAGFHVSGFYDKVIDIERCHLQPEPSNLIRNAVRDYSLRNDLQFYNPKDRKGFLRNLVIRNSLDGKFMVIVVFFHEDTEKREALLDFLGAEFPEISSLMYVINTKGNDSLNDQEPVLYNGDSFLLEKMDDLVFRIGPKSFYQTNTRQALTLYKAVKELAGLSGNEIVYDLYTGTGTIAAFLAGSAGKVIGIEYVSEAIKDANVNAELNKIGNTFFFTGDIKDILTEQFCRENGNPDVVITDPPRAGMHEDVVKAIMEAGPGRIVYVSCNPSTQARDILLLSDKYRITAVQPVDMFPHTHHVENVVLLERKDG